jgi:hypothetical protein
MGNPFATCGGFHGIKGQTDPLPQFVVENLNAPVVKREIVGVLHSALLRSE